MKHHKNTYRRFLDYLKDRLSTKERNAYERETLADPFEIEAMEGLDLLETKQQIEDTENLFIEVHTKGKKVGKNNYYRYRIAASVLVIFGISALIFTSVDTDKQQEEFFTIPENRIDINVDVDEEVDEEVDENDDNDIDKDLDIDIDLDKEAEKEVGINYEDEANYDVEADKNGDENSSIKGGTKYEKDIDILDKDEIDEQVIIESSTDDNDDEFVESVQHKQNRETIQRERNASKEKNSMQQTNNTLPNSIEKKPSKIERNALESLSEEQDLEDEIVISPRPNVRFEENKSDLVPKDRKAISPMGNRENFKNWLLEVVDNPSKNWLLQEETYVIITISKKGIITDIQYINSINTTINKTLDSVFLKTGIWKPAIKKATFVQDTIHIKYTKK